METGLIVLEYWNPIYLITTLNYEQIILHEEMHLLITVHDESFEVEPFVVSQAFTALTIDAVVDVLYTKSAKGGVMQLNHHN